MYNIYAITLLMQLHPKGKMQIHPMLPEIFNNAVFTLLSLLSFDKVKTFKVIPTAK